MINIPWIFKDYTIKLVIDYEPIFMLPFWIRLKIKREKKS